MELLFKEITACCHNSWKLKQASCRQQLLSVFCCYFQISRVDIINDSLHGPRGNFLKGYPEISPFSQVVGKHGTKIRAAGCQNDAMTVNLFMLNTQGGISKNFLLPQIV